MAKDYLEDSKSIDIYHLDSDNEQEDFAAHNAKITKRCKDVIIKKKSKKGNPTDYTFLLYLGSEIQNLGNDFLNGENITKRYKELKTEYLRSLDSTEQDKLVDELKNFVETNKQELFAIFPDELDKNLKQHYLDLFVHIVGNKQPMPEAFKFASGKTKLDVLTAMRKSDDLSLTISNIAYPKKDKSLLLKIDDISQEKFFALAKLLNRYSRSYSRVLSYIHADNTEGMSTVHLDIENLGADFSVQMTFYSKSNKVSQYLTNLGRYFPKPNKKSEAESKQTNKYVFDQINEENRDRIIDAVYGLVREGPNSKNLSLLEKKEKILVYRIAQLLFITEVSRNPSAVFTGYMLLELLRNKDISNPKEKERIIKLFPMSMEKAVDASRYINYGTTNTTDFAEGEITPASRLLRTQGEILAEYDAMQGRNELNIIRSLILLSDVDSVTKISAKDMIKNMKTAQEILNSDKIKQILGSIEEQRSIIENSLNTTYKAIEGHIKSLQRIQVAKNVTNGEETDARKYLIDLVDRYKKSGNVAEFAEGFENMIKHYGKSKIKQNKEKFNTLNNLYENDIKPLIKKISVVKQEEIRILESTKISLEQELKNNEVKKNIQEQLNSLYSSGGLKKDLHTSLKNLREEAFESFGMDVPKQDLSLSIDIDVKDIISEYDNESKDIPTQSRQTKLSANERIRRRIGNKRSVHLTNRQDPGSVSNKSPKIKPKSSANKREDKQDSNNNLTATEELLFKGDYSIKDKLFADNPSKAELLSEIYTKSNIEVNINIKFIDAAGRSGNQSSDKGSVSFITEQDHRIDHVGSTEFLKNQISSGKIGPGSVIALERLQYGNDLGIKDVIALSHVIEHDINIPADVRGSMIESDARLYLEARKAGVKVIGFEGNNLQEGRESNLHDLNREQYMADMIGRVQACGFDVIVNVGASHKRALQDRLEMIQSSPDQAKGFGADIKRGLDKSRVPSGKIGDLKPPGLPGQSKGSSWVERVGAQRKRSSFRSRN